MGYTDAKPDRRPGDKSKHQKLRVTINDGDDPLPAGGGKAGQKLARPASLTGRKPKRN